MKSITNSFFDFSSWNKIVENGWDSMVDRFIEEYEVLFDASVYKPVAAKSAQKINEIGFNDGMRNVGEHQNEISSLNKDIFRAQMVKLIENYDSLDALSFFKLVHLAYDKAQGDSNKKDLFFYHIHNPDDYAKLNFLRLAPEVKWLTIVREPIQACESWIGFHFNNNAYATVSNYIRDMLFQISDVVHSAYKMVGVRLEDLKRRPKKTIPALCKWMGISEKETLYEMTTQGKKWWGDPNSPDYNKTGMDPFGKSSINRKSGLVFSPSDQLVLRTLFYPFSVRFDYVEDDGTLFKENLKKIRPMLDNLFDFEKKIIERTQGDINQFVRSEPFLRLRLGLINRWEVLETHNTYPNLMKHLKV